MNILLDTILSRQPHQGVKMEEPLIFISIGEDARGKNYSKQIDTFVDIVHNKVSYKLIVNGKRECGTFDTLEEALVAFNDFTLDKNEKKQGKAEKVKSIIKTLREEPFLAISIVIATYFLFVGIVGYKIYSLPHGGETLTKLYDTLPILTLPPLFFFVVSLNEYIRGVRLK